MLIEELEQDLGKGNSKSIYVLHGEEKFLLDTIVKKIRKNFGKCINGINYISIDETNISNLISDIQTPAFGYPKKLIIVKNSGILKKEGKKKNPELAKIKSNLAEYIENNISDINESVVLCACVSLWHTSAFCFVCFGTSCPKVGKGGPGCRSPPPSV